MYDSRMIKTQQPKIEKWLAHKQNTIFVISETFLTNKLYEILATPFKIYQQYWRFDDLDCERLIF